MMSKLIKKMVLYLRWNRVRVTVDAMCGQRLDGCVWGGRVCVCGRSWIPVGRGVLTSLCSAMEQVKALQNQNTCKDTRGNNENNQAKKTSKWMGKNNKMNKVGMNDWIDKIHHLAWSQTMWCITKSFVRVFHILYNQFQNCFPKIQLLGRFVWSFLQVIKKID